jgi:hypothetical protein
MEYPVSAFPTIRDDTKYRLAHVSEEVLRIQREGISWIRGLPVLLLTIDCRGRNLAVGLIMGFIK